MQGWHMNTRNENMDVVFSFTIDLYDFPYHIQAKNIATLFQILSALV
jgi:hypothetical protein